MARLKTSNTPDLQPLLASQNPIMLAVEQAILRGQEWSHGIAPVAEQIAVRIAGAITLDLVHAGQRLLEADISAVLHVSRAPVREALRILERERLVEFQPRRGAVVTSPQPQDLRDIYIVRDAVFAIMLRQLMEDCPAELEAVFERHVPRIAGAAKQSADAYACESFLLNLAMTKLCSNRLIVELLTSISLRTLRYMRLGLAANPSAIPGSVESWRALQHAISSRDIDAVLRTAHRRIMGSRDAAVRAIEPPIADAHQRAEPALALA
jgi:DNA-binding GntR family transcriptional regulator